jgi:hypothetical protein
VIVGNVVLMIADGLNYDTEWSETNANRHVQLIDAMLKDGM